MKKGILKLFLSILVFCTFLISGCEFNKSKTASTVTISVRTEFENMRSAIPTININDYTWSVSAKKSDGTEASSPSEPETSRLYFFNDITEGTWIFTVIGKKDEKTVFSGTKEIKIKNGTNYSETIFANYVDNSSDNGSIDLQIVLNEMGSFEINVYKDSIEDSNKVNLKDNDFGKKLSIDSILQGDYDFYFEIKNGTTTICVIKQKICVRANVTTDRWIYSGEVYIIPIAENVAMFKLTKKIIQNYVDTNIYVHGNGGTLSAPASGTTGNGSWNNPYTSLKDAFDKFAALNDGVTPYTIWIDGEVVNNDTTSSGYLFSENSLGINLSILGLNGSREKDVINLNSKSGLISVDPNNAKQEETSSLNIKNLTIINASAFYGSVIYNSNNGINAVIDNCYFKDNTATTNGGVFQFSASDGELEIINSIFEGNTAKFGGAISTAAQTTIYNCTFTKNHASFGGAINSESSGSNHITLSGKVIAQNNYITEDENTLSNVWLNEYGNNDDSEKLILANDFSDESCVGVTLNQRFDLKSTSFIEGYGTSEAGKSTKKPSSIIFSDKEYEINWDKENDNFFMFKLEVRFKFSRTTVCLDDPLDLKRTIVITPVMEFNDSFKKEDLSSFTAELFLNDNKIGDSINLSANDLFFDSSSALSDNKYTIKVKAIYKMKEYSTDQKVYIGHTIVVDNGAELINSIKSGDISIECNFSSTYEATESEATEISADDFPSKTIRCRSSWYAEDYDGEVKALFPITSGTVEIDGNNKEIKFDTQVGRVFAISGENTNVVIKNLTITSDKTKISGNYAVKGKAIYVEKGATVTLINCNINNFYNAKEGIVQVVNGTLKMESCILSDNYFTSSDSSGGALKVDENGNCNAENCTISNNKGAHLGAGVFNEGVLNMYGCTISENDSTRASGLYSSGSDLILTETVIKNNKHYSGYYTNAASGIWVTNPSANNLFDQCKFEENTCGNSITQYAPEFYGGGAIFVENTSLTIKDCTFNNNKSQRTGGAIQIYASSNSTTVPSLTFEGTTTVSGNSASGNGAFLYISSEVGAKIDGTTYPKGQYSDEWPLKMQ